MGRSSSSGSSTGTVVSPFSFTTPMGRVTMNGKCTPTNCGRTGFHTSFSYDLAGDLASYGTAENNITFSYQYDTAARPTRGYQQPGRFHAPHHARFGPQLYARLRL